MADNSRKQRRYRNTVGRVVVELLYGSTFESSKGLSRVISLSDFSKRCNIRIDNLIEILEFMETVDMVDSLVVSRKTATIKIAPPVGIRKKT